MQMRQAAEVSDSRFEEPAVLLLVKGVVVGFVREMVWMEVPRDPGARTAAGTGDAGLEGDSAGSAVAGGLGVDGGCGVAGEGGGGGQCLPFCKLFVWSLIE